MYKNDLLERIDTFATYSVECNVPRGVNVSQEKGTNITNAKLVEGESSEFLRKFHFVVFKIFQQRNGKWEQVDEKSYAMNNISKLWWKRVL